MTRPLALALLCCLATCARKEAPRGADRIAILPLENLSGDASLDWVGPATAAIAVGQAAGSPTLHPFLTPTRQDALRARATRIVSGYYSAVGSSIRANAIDEDLRTGKTRPLSSTAKMEPDPGALASALVRQIGLEPRPRGPKNTEAARQYGLALAAVTENARREALEKSLAAEPSYGEARVGLVETMLTRGDRAQVERFLADIPQGTDDLSRARLDMARATLAGDANARIDALRKISDLAPADGEVARAFASLLTSRRRFDEAIRAYRRAIAADPETGILWNDLTYAQAFAGDLDGARASLAEYDRLDPASANPRDSLGEVFYYYGRFEEAEAAFLEAHRRNPLFLGGGGLVKAAQSALKRGDKSRGDEHMKRFLEIRRKSDAAGAERIEAQWDFLAGRRKEARDRLEKLASKLEAAPGGAAVDWAQLAVWSLVEGDRVAARSFAKLSAARPGPSGLPVVAALAAFVTEPSAPAAEWKARAERAFPGAGLATLRRQAQAYALFADGKFADAGPLLREIIDSVAPNGDGLFRAMLGVALRETGAKDESSRLLARHAMPTPGGWDIFMPLVFSKLTP